MIDLSPCSHSITHSHRNMLTASSSCRQRYKLKAHCLSVALTARYMKLQQNTKLLRNSRSWQWKKKWSENENSKNKKKEKKNKKLRDFGRLQNHKNNLPDNCQLLGCVERWQMNMKLISHTQTKWVWVCMCLCVSADVIVESIMFNGTKWRMHTDKNGLQLKRKRIKI